MHTLKARKTKLVLSAQGTNRLWIFQAALLNGKRKIKFLLASLKTLTNSKDGSESRVRISVPEAQFIVPDCDWGDKVDKDIGLLYRPVTSGFICWRDGTTTVCLFFIIKRFSSVFVHVVVGFRNNFQDYSRLSEQLLQSQSKSRKRSSEDYLKDFAELDRDFIETCRNIIFNYSFFKTQPERGY